MMERPFEHEKKLEQDLGSGISPFKGASRSVHGSGKGGLGGSVSSKEIKS